MEELNHDLTELKKLPEYALRYAEREILRLSALRGMDAASPANDKSRVVMKQQAKAIWLAAAIVGDIGRQLEEKSEKKQNI